MKIRLAFIGLILIFSCKTNYEGTFYITNSSRDQAEVPLRLIIDNDTIFDKTVKYSNIRPDLQHIEKVKLKEGQHQIIFEVASINLKRIENIKLDKHKWFFLSYRFKKADSIEGLSKGEKPNLTFNITETEPIHH